MTRKQWTLVILAVLLGGFSLYLNKDWFAKDSIQIISLSRATRSGGRAQGDSATVPVIFGLSRSAKLTSVKVLSVSDLETNKHPRPLWHLVSDSNSVPVKEFLYGNHIHGMHPEIKGAQAEPLEPGVTYRLFLEAGSLKAEHDFKAVAQDP